MSLASQSSVQVNNHVVDVLVFPSVRDGSPQVSASVVYAPPCYRACTDTTSGPPERNAVLGVPEDTRHVARCTVSPKWSHEPAVATLLAAYRTLDALGLGLVIEVNPYPRATKADRKRLVAWLREHGFVTCGHGHMFRAASPVTEVHFLPVQA